MVCIITKRTHVNDRTESHQLVTVLRAVETINYREHKIAYDRDNIGCLSAIKSPCRYCGHAYDTLTVAVRRQVEFVVMDDDRPPCLIPLTAKIRCVAASPQSIWMPHSSKVCIRRL